MLLLVGIYLKNIKELQGRLNIFKIIFKSRKHFVLSYSALGLMVSMILVLQSTEVFFFLLNHASFLIK